MKFDKEIWQKAQILESRLHEFEDIGIKREFFAKELNIPEQTARAILYALENRDLIAGTPEIILARDGDIEFAIGDLHIPFVDRHALDTAINYAVKHHNITIVNIMGDLLDLYKSSFFRKDPTKGMTIIDELKYANEILAYIRQAFPSAHINLLEGNHELRFMDCVDTKSPDYHGVVEGLLQNKLGLAELGIEYKNKFFKYGELWHLHGHERKGGYAVINVCKIMLDRVMDNFVTFHFHTTQEYIKKRIDNSIIGGYAVGHLAKDEAFAYNPLNNWNQGFAVIEYDSNGEFTMHNKKICNGKIF